MYTYMLLEKHLNYKNEIIWKTRKISEETTKINPTDFNFILSVILKSAGDEMKIDNKTICIQNIKDVFSENNIGNANKYMMEQFQTYMGINDNHTFPPNDDHTFPPTLNFDDLFNRVTNIFDVGKELYSNTLKEQYIIILKNTLPIDMMNHMNLCNIHTECIFNAPDITSIKHKLMAIINFDKAFDWNSNMTFNNEASSNDEENPAHKAKNCCYYENENNDVQPANSFMYDEDTYIINLGKSGKLPFSLWRPESDHQTLNITNCPNFAKQNAMPRIYFVYFNNTQCASLISKDLYDKLTTVTLHVYNIQVHNIASVKKNDVFEEFCSNTTFDSFKSFMVEIDEFSESTQKITQQFISEFIKDNFTLSTNKCSKIKFTGLFEDIVALLKTDGTKISDEQLVILKYELPTVLKQLDLHKTRLSDGMYWYGITPNSAPRTLKYCHVPPKLPTRITPVSEKENNPD